MTLPKEDQAMIHLETKRWNENADCSLSHSVYHHLTTRSDDEEILDGLLSKMDEIEKDSDKAVADVIVCLDSL